MPTFYFASLALAALLSLSSAAAGAASFTYRVAAKGLLAPAPASETGSAGGGVVFLRNGTPISELHLVAGQEATLVIRNSSSVTVSGFLLQSAGGFVRADMTRTTCSQSVDSSVPLVLAPGASCQFVLMEPDDHSNLRPDDVFYLRSATNEPISAMLALPGMSADPVGGGGLPPPDGL